MSYILHMSDFHFGKNMKIEQGRLDELAMWIENSDINIKYLIFTGDIIDAQVLQADCVKKLKKEYSEEFKDLKPTDDPNIVLDSIRAAGNDCIDFYDNLVRETTLIRIKQAGKIFLSFIDRIGVDKQNVVLCCGNHDRMRFAGESDFKCNGTYHFDESIMDEQFEAYDTLCNMINNRLSHRTMVYPCNGINFVIVNSNWKMPVQNETNKMCVSCNSLSESLSQLRQSETFNRNQTILIAHKPYDDFCESVKYPYNGEQLTVLQIIERTVTAFLYGDKHSHITRMNNKPREFMCGLPLSYRGVCYNLLDFDSNTGIRSCCYLLNDGRGWTKVPITDCVELIYNLSKRYLKGFAFTLLTGKHSVPDEWDVAIKSMQDANNTETLTELSKLFTTFSDLRQGQKTIEIDENSLFSQLISQIENSTLQSVSIKGRPGVGKSTFMTLVYLYVLWMFSEGKSRYIPFYFNMETIIAELPEDISSSHNIDKYISHAEKEFFDYLSNCIKLSEAHHLPLFLFVDGMEKSKALAPGDNTLEKRIYQLIETTLNKKDDRYVMCFNTHDSYHFDQTFEKINRFDYVLFMNRTRIISYKSNEQKQDIFLSNYLALRGRPSNDSALRTIKKSLAKFRKPSIDLFFLHHYEQSIFEIGNDDKIWNVLKVYLTELEKIADNMFGFRIDIAMETAGLLFSQRKRYSEVVKLLNVNSPTIVDFFSIINSPDVENYLIARYFVYQLLEYSDTQDAIPEKSILFSFIPNQISIIIRLILDKKGKAANDILARFIDLHSNELKGYLYSMIAYLCGHLRTDGCDFLLAKLPTSDREPDDFFALCSRRSYDLAKAVCDDDKSLVQKIILELIENEKYRKFNRSYQLHYYQDVSNNAILNQSEWNLDKAPLVGFDFRYSFLMLLSKLESALEESKPYPLMELDLFTICDLVYSRLQHMVPNAFFYSAKYNEKDDSECEAVMSRTVALLVEYNKIYGRKRSGNDRINAYFSLMSTRLSAVQKKVTENVGKEISVPYVSPCYDFEQVLKFSALARVGWNIDIPGTIKVENQPIYTAACDEDKSISPIRETLMQHIMESVYMALLFLPDNLPEKDYKKSQVISLLLLSELGKTYSGDYSPLYSNQYKCRNIEEKGLAHMLTLGALDGYAAQPVFFKPLSDMLSVDINMRICREIKMIQMEFKYYTLYHQLGFTDDRRAEFENDFEEPTTSICKIIREQLILNNPKFKEFLNL